jgi:hypothetical protein
MKIICTARDLKSAQYWELAKLVRAIRKEVERRNPIGVNFYTGHIEAAAVALDEISGGEVGNFTSECGPRENRPAKQVTNVQRRERSWCRDCGQPKGNPEAECDSCLAKKGRV